MDTYYGASGQLYGDHTKSGKHYVYQHVNPLSGIVFYVGMGRCNRCNQIKQRNKYWVNYFRKHGMRVEILEKDLSKKDALVLEAKYIKSIKPRCNFTEGGECGNPIKRKVSAFHKNGDLYAEYDSIADANIALNALPNDSRIVRCLNGSRMRFKGLFWSESAKKCPTPRERKHKRAKTVHQYDLLGNWVASFDSPKDVNVPTRTGIYGALDKDLTYAGFFWRSEKTEKIHVVVPEPALREKKKVICTRTGVIYNSVQEAAKALDIPNQTLSKKLRKVITNNTGLEFYVKETNNPQNNQRARA